MKTLKQQLESATKQLGSKNAIVWDEKAMTFDEFFAAVKSVSLFLSNLGVKEGVVVCTVFDNCPAAIIVLFAVNDLGGTCAPLEIGLSAPEAKGLVTTCDASVLCCSPEFEARFSNLFPRTLILDDEGSIEESLDQGPINLSFARDAGLIAFSSGTTGNPKAIVIAKKALLYRSTYLIKPIGLDQNERTLVALPLSHSHGLECLTLSTLMAGGTVFLYSPRFAYPQYILEELSQHKITFFSSVPQFYDYAVRLSPFEKSDLSGLRFPFCGSAALSAATARLFFEKFGVSIKQGYGLTELPVICLNQREDPSLDYDSVGNVISGVEWQIEGGSDEGELLVRSEALFDSYWHNPEETAFKIQKGWLHTGDLVSRDSKSGSFRIIGRKDDFIKVGGLKVFPSEIEQALISLSEVKECAVLGRRDDSGSETITAYIVPAAECMGESLENLLVERLRGLISDYKIPREFYFRSSLPKSPLGKIAKSKIAGL